MTVYLDSLFTLNFIMDYLLLLATGKVAGETARRWRLALGGLLGALTAALSFVPGFTWLAAPPCKGSTAVLMVLLAFGHSRRLGRVGLCFLGLCCALGGGVFLAGLLLGQGFQLRQGVLLTSMDVKVVLFSAAVCYAVLSLVFRRVGRHVGRELLPVVVSIGGKKLLLTALRDTGNTLTDPATGRPVLVAEGEGFRNFLPEALLERLEQPAEALEQFGGEGLGRRLRLLPYRSVGVSSGCLLAVRTDRVSIGKEEYGGLLVALSPTPVSDGGGYQALFGG